MDDELLERTLGEMPDLPENYEDVFKDNEEDQTQQEEEVVQQEEEIVEEDETAPATGNNTTKPTKKKKKGQPVQEDEEVDPSLSAPIMQEHQQTPNVSEPVPASDNGFTAQTNDPTHTTNDDFVMDEFGRIHSAGYQKVQEEVHNFDNTLTQEIHRVQELDDKYVEAASTGATLAGLDGFTSDMPAASQVPVTPIQQEHQENVVPAHQETTTPIVQPIQETIPPVQEQEVITPPGVVPPVITPQTTEETMHNIVHEEQHTGHTPNVVQPVPDNVIPPAEAPAAPETTHIPGTPANTQSQSTHTEQVQFIPVEQAQVEQNTHTPRFQATSTHIENPAVHVATDIKDFTPVVAGIDTPQSTPMQPNGAIPFIPTPTNPVGGTHEQTPNGSIIPQSQEQNRTPVQPVAPTQPITPTTPVGSDNKMPGFTPADNRGAGVGGAGVIPNTPNAPITPNASSMPPLVPPTPGGAGGSGPNGPVVPGGPGSNPPGGPNGPDGGGNSPVPPGGPSNKGPNVNRDDEKWNPEIETHKSKTDELHVTSRPANDVINPADRKQERYGKAEERLGEFVVGMTKSGVKEAADEHEDREYRKAKGVVDSVMDVASAIGMAGLLDTQKAAASMLKRSAEDAAQLISDGKISLADFQAADKGRSLKQSLEAAGYSKSDITRIVRHRDEVAGLFEMKDAVIKDMRSFVNNKLGVVTEDNASIADLRNAVGKALTKDGLLAGKDIDALTRKDILDLAKMSGQENLAKSYLQLKSLEKMKDGDYEQLSNMYLRLSKNDTMRSLADKMGSGTRLNLISDKKLWDLMKKAKKSAEFSAADRQALNLEWKRRLMADARKNAPGLGKVSSRLLKSLADKIDEASNSASLSTMTEAYHYGLSVYALAKKGVLSFDGVGKDVVKLGKTVGAFTKDTFNKGYTALQEKNEKVKQFADNRAEKKAEKVKIKRERAQKKAEKKAARHEKLSNSKAGQVVKKVREAPGKTAANLRKTRAGKFASKANGAVRKVSGAAGKVVAAPFKAVGKVKLVFLKAAGIVAGVILIIYLMTYIFSSVMLVGSAVFDGVFAPIEDLYHTVVEWFTDGPVDPYENLKDLYQDLADDEAERRRQEIQDLYNTYTPVLAGHTTKYSEVKVRFMNSSTGQISSSYDVVNAKKSAIAMAYVMLGDQFYEVDNSVRRELIKDLYNEMATYTLHDESMIPPYPGYTKELAKGSYNIYLCGFHNISPAVAGCNKSNNYFIYHCCGDEFEDDIKTLSNYLDQGVGIYDYKLDRFYSEAQLRRGLHQEYGDFVNYEAICLGHNIYDPNTGKWLHTYYHNDAEKWGGQTSSSNIYKNNLGAPGLGTFTYRDRYGVYRTYTDEDKCYNYGFTELEAEKCQGHYVYVCYGHKDCTLAITHEDARSLMERGFIPSDSKYNDYIKDFKWTSDTRKQVMTYVEDADWGKEYGIYDTGN